MFYGPLHFLLIREIVRALDGARKSLQTILDLGCGTGVAGAAWSLEFEKPPKLIGVDRNAWALEECRWTYGTLGLQGITRSEDVRKLKLPPKTGVIAAFTINELDDESRSRLLDQFLKASSEGAPILIVEPIAKRVSRWWDHWSTEFKAKGGRDDEWRFSLVLPEKLKLMDKSAGLDHRELTGRSLWLS
jgi:predicted RNA methylase